ncbi:MAG: septum formation initiator family protein [Thermoleophilia bacterium]
MRARRIFLAGLLTAILIGYIGPISGYLDQRAELREERAKLAGLEAQRDAFREQIARLGQAPVLEARARELGLVMPGERAFLVRGDLDPEPAESPDEGDDGGAFGWFTALF